MNQPSFESLTIQRSSKRIKKLKNELHLTLTKDKTREIQIKPENLQNIQNRISSFKNSLPCLPIQIRNYLAEKKKIAKEDIEVLSKSITHLPEFPMEKQVEDIRYVVKIQQESIQELSIQSLKNIPHDHLQKYLKSLVKKSHLIKTKHSEPSSQKEIMEKTNVATVGALNEESEEENFTLFRKDSKNSMILFPASISSLTSINETTTRGEDSSFDNSSSFFISKEHCKIEQPYQSSYNFTPSTTPNTSKKNSPLFNEKKNLLLSSKIENIINEGEEIFCKRFDEENLSIENSFIEESPMKELPFYNGRNQNFEEFEDDADEASVRVFNDSLLLLEHENLGFF